MADQVAGLEIRVESETVEKARKSLADLSRQGANAESAMKKVGEGGVSAASGVAKYSDATNLAERSNQRLIDSLKATVAGYISLRSAATLVNISDEYTKLTAQLKLATNSQQEYSEAYRNSIRIANTAQTSLADTATFYARISNATRELGANQQSVSDITESVSLALKLSGASAAEASSALQQLSQAFGKGALNGDEFNTVSEALPVVLRGLAKDLNIPIGQLKEMGAQGLLTADIFGNYLIKSLNEFRKQAAETNTIAGGFTVLTNNLKLVIGELDKATQAGNSLALTIKSIGEGGVIVEVFKTIAVLGINVAYVFQQVGREIGGIGAQFAALAKLDFSGFSNIRKVMVDDAKKAREEVDKLSESILNPKGLDPASTQSVANKLSKPAQIASDNIKKVVDKTNSYATQLANTYADLFTKAVALNAPQETQAQTLQRLLDGFKSADGAARQFIQTQIDLANSAADDTYITNQLKALDAQTESVLDQAKAVEAEVEAYGKLPSQITDVTIARLNDRKALLESLGLGVQDVEAQITAYERLRQAQSGKEFQEKQAAQQKATVEAAKKTADEVQRNYERASDNISRSLSDALLRGFENGKSFAENFKDTLVNMFKTLILQPVIKFLIDSSGLTKILGAVSGTLSGVANAGGVAGAASSGSTLSTLVSTGKSLYSAFTQGIDAIGASIVGSIGDLGTFLVDKGFSDLGGLIGQYNTQIANVLPYSAAILQLVQGDVKGAAITGAATAIGSIWGPGGAALGAAVGSLLGSAFGGRAKNPRIGAASYGVYQNGEFTTTGVDKGGSKKFVSAYAQPLSDLGEAFATRLGSFLNQLGTNATIGTRTEFATKNKKGTIASLTGSVNGVAFGDGSQSYSKDATQAWADFVSTALGRTLVQAIQASPIDQAFKDLFSGFADKDQVSSLMQSVVNFKTASEELADTYGITAEVAARIARAGGSSNEEIAAFAKTFSEFSLSLMKPSEQLLLAKTNITKAITDIVDSVGALDSLSSFDNLLKGIDTATAQGQQQFADLFKLRDSFSSYISSLDSVKSSVDSTVLSLMSPSDQLAKYQSDLAAAFDELNLSMPGSIEELIALGQSIDYTTEAGLDLALAFPSLVSAFQSAQSATDALMDSLNSLDTNKFKTLFDLNRYKAVATNFGSSFANNYQKTALPSFDVGTNYVPNDMTANIHKGERIIPAADNSALMQKLSQSDNGELVAAVNRLEQANKSMARNMASMERKIAKWDGDGLPAERVVTA